MPTTLGKSYRNALGFTRQKDAKSFFKATDIVVINWTLIDSYNIRLKQIFSALNEIVTASIKNDMDAFNLKFDSDFKQIQENDIIYLLNNFGRSRESVYYNWMRGHLVCIFFLKAISLIFDIGISEIVSIGNDDFSMKEKFIQTPVADYEFKKNNKIIRVEVQAGFSTQHDIKKHKVLEARKEYIENQITTYIFHVDLFNGRSALIEISDSDDAKYEWAQNNRFEGQYVSAISNQCFKWDITQPVVSFDNLVS